MKRLLERLTFILIGAVLVISGNVLNNADVGNVEVTHFDEIRCRKIVIDDGTKEGKMILGVDAGTPYIFLEHRSGGVFNLFTGDGVVMKLGFIDPVTDTKISEIELITDKNSARITHSVQQK